MHDYHVHSNYSDGGFLYAMIAAAERAGLDGVGVADHCNVSERTAPRREKRLLGFTMDTTYGRRREAIRELRDQFDLTVHDAVEMDYDPRDEELIRAFLDEAEFDYAVGSVHHVRDTNVQSAGEWADLDERECRAVVDDHFDALVALVESELFDIAMAVRDIASEELQQSTKLSDYWSNFHELDRFELFEEVARADQPLSGKDVAERRGEKDNRQAISQALIDTTDGDVNPYFKQGRGKYSLSFVGKYLVQTFRDGAFEGIDESEDDDEDASLDEF